LVLALVNALAHRFLLSSTLTQQSCNQLNKEAAQRFISAGLGGDSGNSKKREKPDSEESGKKKKKKSK
jgi:hypothetical protein